MCAAKNIHPKSNTIAVAYLRKSDSRQSLETQRAKAIDYASKNNLNLSKNMIFTETKPASTPMNTPMVTDLSVVFKHRPEMLKILEMACRHEFTDLIVYCNDRLARNLYHNALIKNRLEKNNVTLHFTKEGENFKTDPLNRKLQNLLACYDEFEASAISIRVSDCLNQVFKRGDWPGGRVPFGFEFKDTATGKTLDIDKSKMEIVQTIFELYSASYGYRKIADIMSRKYFPYKFHKSTIEYIINNDTYFGKLHFGKKGGRRKNYIKNTDYLKSEYIESIDMLDGTTKYIVALLRKYKPNIKDPQYFSSPYILKDLLVCAKCGQKLKVKNYGGNRASVYRCPTHENGKSHNIIKTELIDTLVFEKVKNIKYSKEDLKLAHKKYTALFNKNIKLHENIISDIDNKIAEFEINTKNINEMLAGNPEEYLIKELEKHKLYFKQQINLLLNQKEHNEKLTKETPISFDEFSNTVNKLIEKIPDKRILCFFIIDNIVISNDNNNLKLDMLISPKVLG